MSLKFPINQQTSNETVRTCQKKQLNVKQEKIRSLFLYWSACSLDAWVQRLLDFPFSKKIIGFSLSSTFWIN